MSNSNSIVKGSVGDAALSRTCSRCRVEKSVAEFSKAKTRKDGIEPQCKACVSERGRLWYQRNKERNYARSRKWALAHPEKARESVRKARATHIDDRRVYERKRYESNPAFFKAKTRAYHRANPQKSAQDYAKRYAKTKVVNLDYEFIAERDGMVCYLCGQPIAESERQFDHVVPLCKDGEHSYENVKVVHDNCNRKKGRKTVEEYRRLEAKLYDTSNS
jgi:5-methylcytosine-specific restriction endonuclease McrA